MGMAWVLAWAIPAVAQLAPPARPIIIKDLTVEGNRRVQEAVILGRIQSKPGTSFSYQDLKERLTPLGTVEIRAGETAALDGKAP